ncbi:MAG TPA: hypothetical protein VMU33_07025 [Burkholderiaceae bacterium]|nr:hypothetical protein [Burkholderiaceae bacterium]
MVDLLLAHASDIALVVAAFAAIAAILATGWEAIALRVQSAWHSIPLVGGIAWLARRERRREGMERMGSQSSAVVALCGSYARFIRVLNRADYDNNMNYLRKAGDLGRKPFPSVLWVVIFSMVLVEAAGLAYVLAGWTLPGASEFAQRIAAGGIGFLIAVILVFFTHWAGVEIYHSKLYRRDRREWLAAGRQGALFGPDLSLNDAQNVDDGEPAFRQRATRGHGKSSYVLTTITMIMVLAVGSGAAFVRGQVLEQELVLEQATRQHTLLRFELDGADTTAAAGERAAAEQRVVQQEVEIKRRGGWGTLIILAVIFFFLQLLGIFFGYRYSFNGRLSRDAYRALMADRFSSYSELLQYYDRIADVAQSKVERLQQLLERKHGGGMGRSLGLHYTFRDYLQTREAHRRDKPLGGEPEGADASDAGVAGGEAAPPAHAETTPAPIGVATETPLQAAADAAAPVATAAGPALRAASTTGGDVPTGSPIGSAADSPADASTDASTDAPPAGIFPPHRFDAPLAAVTSARAQLELAEKLERQRAAERATRTRTTSRRRAATQPESEPG